MSAGPAVFASVLALAIRGAAGMLGKFFPETIEEVDAAKVLSFQQSNARFEARWRGLALP